MQSIMHEADEMPVCMSRRKGFSVFMIVELDKGETPDQVKSSFTKLLTKQDIYVMEVRLGAASIVSSRACASRLFCFHDDDVRKHIYMHAWAHPNVKSY
jgi:hypothetical protein